MHEPGAIGDLQVLVKCGSMYDFLVLHVSDPSRDSEAHPNGNLLAGGMTTEERDRRRS